MAAGGPGSPNGAMKLLLLLTLLQDPAEPRLKPLVTATEAPPVVLFAPGLEVRELPVSLSNLNNLEYAADGRLFAAGYDGRLHLLRDSDGDGLEDQISTFHEKTGDDYPLGMAVRGGDVYVLRRNAVMRHRDTNADGVPDLEETAASGWQDPEGAKMAHLTHRRVDDALGLALAPDGTTYVTMGAANYSNGYLLTKEGKSRLELDRKRGCLLAISPDGKDCRIVATGVRFIVCLQFNRHGDLFGADQEGATWLPNGNPFDELLHLQAGRHYGFPPRHPKHLPDVIDEPSLFDYGPQHQSTCGFRFNEARADRAAFGPAEWEGDAFVTAMSRGKLYRTQLVKTAAGYVAKNRLFGSLGLLPIDVAISPKGDLVLACHSGAPDWGSGPKGMGKLFKISWKDKAAPQPVLAWPSGPGETVVAYDRPLDPASVRDLARKAGMESGAFVTEGDRFERFRPGYQVVKNQMKAPRFEHPLLSAALGADRRTLLLRTAPREAAVGYALSLPGTVELAYDLSGVEAEWTASEGGERWKGWLPHADLAVARAFTRGSADHDRLWTLLERSGRLRLGGQLDLSQMLQPAVQPGSTLDFEYPAEQVTLDLKSGTPLQPEGGLAALGERDARLALKPGAAWIPLAFSIGTGPGTRLDVSWHTAEDARPRALPLRRLLLPWARKAGAPPEPPRLAAELEGGRWSEGKQIFFGERTACGKCHSIRGEGGKIGPDLSNLPHRDYASVLQDLQRPSAAINPDHLSYTVKLTSGDILAGVILQAGPESFVFGTTAGESVTVARGRVERMEPSSLSLMPEKLLEGLSPAQLRDLMTFLLTAR